MKQLVDFPNYYITMEGIVINKKNHIIKPFINNKGYVLVRLWNNNKSVSKLVHRLVAETFIPKIEGKCEVNHIDGDKQTIMLTIWNGVLDKRIIYTLNY